MALTCLSPRAFDIREERGFNVRSRTAFLLVVAAAMGQWLANSAASDSKAGSDIKYDSAAVIVVSGPVEEVLEIGAPDAVKGIHVFVRSDRRVIQVYLCPASFLKRFDLTLRKGDYIHISGARIKFQGKDLVLARQLTKNHNILELRDDRGNPYWEDEILRGPGLDP